MYGSAAWTLASNSDTMSLPAGSPSSRSGPFDPSNVTNHTSGLRNVTKAGLGSATGITSASSNAPQSLTGTISVLQHLSHTNAEAQCHGRVTKHTQSTTAASVPACLSNDACTHLPSACCAPLPNVTLAGEQIHPSFELRTWPGTPTFEPPPEEDLFNYSNRKTTFLLDVAAMYQQQSHSGTVLEILEWLQDLLECEGSKFNSHVIHLPRLKSLLSRAARDFADACYQLFVPDNLISAFVPFCAMPSLDPSQIMVDTSQQASRSNSPITPFMSSATLSASPFDSDELGTPDTSPVLMPAAPPSLGHAMSTSTMVNERMLDLMDEAEDDEMAPPSFEMISRLPDGHEFSVPNLTDFFGYSWRERLFLRSIATNFVHGPHLQTSLEVPEWLKVGQGIEGIGGDRLISIRLPWLERLLACAANDFPTACYTLFTAPTCSTPVIPFLTGAQPGTNTTIRREQSSIMDPVSPRPPNLTQYEDEFKRTIRASTLEAHERSLRDIEEGPGRQKTEPRVCRNDHQRLTL